MSAANQKIYLVVILALASVLAVSGCSAIDIFQINKPVTKVGTRDILAVNSIRTIPYSPVLPDEDVTLEFVIENLDDNKLAKDVYAELYDSAFMRCAGPMLGTYCRPVDNRCVLDNRCQILPLDQEQVFFALKSPTEASISGITSSAQLSFRVIYSSEGGTTMDLIVANYDEIERAQRTGQTIQATSSRSLGSGPVEIEMELLNRDYALSEKSATLKVQIIDLGSHGGTIMGSKIPADRLFLDFSQLSSSSVSMQYTPSPTGSDGSSPSSDSSDSGDRSRGRPTGEATGGACTGTSCTVTTKKFDCNKQIPDVDGTVFSTYGCINTDEIKLINGKSAAMIFKIDNLPSVEIFRTFKIKAKIYYEYELREKADIEVKPYGS